MSQLGRGFVAVVPPDHVLDAIDARVAHVRAAHDGLRWNRREQRHLTLRFLGPVPDVDALVAALRDALAPVPRVAALRLGGAGAFPNVRRASVVWIGVRDGVEALARVASAVESASVRAGFVPEPRPFRAHLTVARVPRVRDVSPALATLGEQPVGGAWTVHDVVLVSSDTRPTGAVYEEVARIPLAGDGPRGGVLPPGPVQGPAALLGSLHSVEVAGNAYGFGISSWDGRGERPEGSPIGFNGVGFLAGDVPRHAEDPLVREGRLPDPNRVHEILDPNGCSG